MLNSVSQMSPEQIRRMIILCAVAELAENRTNTGVGAQDVLDALPHEYEMDRRELADEVGLLEASVLARGLTTLGGLITIYLLAPGKDAVAQFRRDQQDPVARVKQLQDDYLRWLYHEVEIADRRPRPDQYLATEPHYLGRPYTKKELEKAGSRLRDGAFIGGNGASGYSAPLRPDLLAKGRLFVEDNRSVHDSSKPAESAASVTAHIGNNSNVSINGSNFAQTVTANPDWSGPVTEALAAITQALAALPAADRAKTQALVDDAQLAVSNGDRSRVKTTLSTLGRFLGATSSNALGTLLAAQLTTLIASLGS